MIKKVGLIAMLFVLSGLLAGCGQSTSQLVKENLSECTNVYYFGENDEFYCSFASGEREEVYLMDGKSSNRVDFALLSLIFEEQNFAKAIDVTISIDGTKKVYELELNSLNNVYMIDLEKKLSGSEYVEVEYKGNSLVLQNLSNDFGIDANKAIEIASSELEEKILLKKSYANLNAECYLRILDKKANDFDGVFWGFTVLNINNENYSVIISTEDGSILAKSN